MDFGFFLRGLTGVIFKPARFWETLNPDRHTASKILLSYLLPLVILVSLSTYFGSMLFTNTKMELAFSVITAVRCLAVYAVSIYLSTNILNGITHPLDLGRNTAVSFSLIVFSVTPLMLCQLISKLFETFQFVNILALYGLYIFWAGAEKLLNPPDYRKTPLLVAAFVTFTGIFIAADIILKMVAERLYSALFG